MMEMSYFLENEEWYIEYRDERGHLNYKLTGKAPKEAIKSYNKYYKTLRYAENIVLTFKFLHSTIPITSNFGIITIRTSRGRKFVASTQLEIGLRCGVSDTHQEV